jgi:hypothetical protein
MATENCIICDTEIKTMSFKGTGVCGEIHRKMRDGEIPEHHPQVDAGITNILRQPTGEVDPRSIR